MAIPPALGLLCLNLQDTHRITGVYPGYSGYAASTTREISVVILTANH